MLIFCEVNVTVFHDGYLFYFIGADYVNPEYLYYARRRGVLSHINQADNDFVGKTIKEHNGIPAKSTFSRTRSDYSLSSGKS